LSSISFAASIAFLTLAGASTGGIAVPSLRSFALPTGPLLASWPGSAEPPVLAAPAGPAKAQSARPASAAAEALPTNLDRTCVDVRI